MGKTPFAEPFKWSKVIKKRLKTVVFSRNGRGVGTWTPKEKKHEQKNISIYKGILLHFVTEHCPFYCPNCSPFIGIKPPLSGRLLSFHAAVARRNAGERRKDGRKRELEPNRARRVTRANHARPRALFLFLILKLYLWQVFLSYAKYVKNIYTG